MPAGSAPPPKALSACTSGVGSFLRISHTFWSVLPGLPATLATESLQWAERKEGRLALLQEETKQAPGQRKEKHAFARKTNQWARPALGFN